MIHENSAWCLRDDPSNPHVVSHFPVTNTSTVNLVKPLADCSACVAEKLAKVIKELPSKCRVNDNLENLNRQQAVCIRGQLNKIMFSKLLKDCHADSGSPCDLPIPAMRVMRAKNILFGSEGTGTGDDNPVNNQKTEKKAIESPLISLIHGEDRRMAIRAFL